MCDVRAAEKLSVEFGGGGGGGGVSQGLIWFVWSDMV